MNGLKQRFICTGDKTFINPHKPIFNSILSYSWLNTIIWDLEFWCIRALHDRCSTGYFFSQVKDFTYNLSKFFLRLTVESFEYYTMLEEDKRRLSWGKIVILMLKKMMLLDDERVSLTN